MKILVTGGLGYIGSHTVVQLLSLGEELLVVDALYNSKLLVKKKITEITNKDFTFIKLDVSSAEIENVFKEHEFDTVIHFAGFKSIGESVKYPLKYYNNNIMCTINLVHLCIKYNVNNFIFSSSATVYGENPSPVDENMPLLSTTNPYGETKVICERILMDVAKVNPNFNVTLLRYFNPVGAHESGLIGEEPVDKPNNLVPYITQVAAGIRPVLNVFGDNFDTPDGTGIRDYIHVMDLADAHVAAIKYMKPGLRIYNVGTGNGTSVLNIIKKFEEVNKIKIHYKVIERRIGDLAISYANVSKIKRELNWSAKKKIEDMLRDAWNFEKKYRGIK